MLSFNCCTKRNRNEVIALDANKLKGKIVEKGLTISKVSDIIGVNRSTLYRKLNNNDKLTINEACKLKSILELSDSEAIDIFFEV